MAPASKVVAIIDPGDAGVMLAPACHERGAKVIVVRSRSSHALNQPGWQEAATFPEVIDDGNIFETVRQLEEWKTGCVMAGSERGVNLADRISEALDVPSNGTRLSSARRDKFAMIETAGARGLRVPRQIRSATLGPILHGIARLGGWPVILKPLHAAGSEGVRLCSSEDEARAAFESIIGKTNGMALVNDSVLAQEFIGGTEYVVDTVSWEGRHYPAAFWRYGKPEPGYSTAGLFNSKELLPAHGEVQQRLFAYVTGVLDALGIVYGPGHCEVKLDANGPVLIEMAARLHGGPKAHLMCRAATGSSQMEMMVDAYLDPAHFLERSPGLYCLKRTAVMLLLRPPRPSMRPRPSLIRTIETLASLHELSLNGQTGQAPQSVAGLAVLLHRNRSVVDDDLRRIQHMERNGLFH